MGQVALDVDHILTLHEWEKDAARARIRRDCPTDADQILAALGLTDGSQPG